MNKTKQRQAACFVKDKTFQQESIFLLFFLSVFSVSATNGDVVDDLLEIPLESLMQIEVTSVAKKPQELQNTTAAIYVISHEDIRRSGVTTLAEALRLAPGINVGRSNNGGWGIGIRGFNGFFSNKLLVLIDGRTIYSPTFSGVLWNKQDVLLEDIDRIEVIRGSGGTLWGANAVNGVINIITRHTQDSQGGLLQAGIGNIENPTVAIRYGDKLSEDIHYRVYGKYADHGTFEEDNGTSIPGDWQHKQLGGRLDWRLSARDELTIQGDAYYGEYESLFTLPVTSLVLPISPTLDTVNHYGTNILARWGHTTDSNGKVTVQAYYDRFHTNDEFPFRTVDTWDLDFQHQFALHERVQMLWGLGYRRVHYSTEPTVAIVVDPLSNNLDLFSGFVQGDISLTEKLRLTLGSKFEHNEFTGFEIQPNLRLLWKFSEKYSLWGAVSRAIRTPAPSETLIRANLGLIPGTPPILRSSFANPDLESEKLISYELGVRGELRSNLSLDVSGFYNDYDKLVGPVANPVPVFESTPAPPHILVSTMLDNILFGESYGIEAMVRWQLCESWRLEGSYTFQKTVLHPENDPFILSDGSGGEGENPQQQFQLRSYLDLSHNLEFDVTLFWVDQLPAFDIKDYLRMDLHLGWQPITDVKVDLFLQNLLDNRHQEFQQRLNLSNEVPRTAYVRVQWAW